MNPINLLLSRSLLLPWLLLTDMPISALYKGLVKDLQLPSQINTLVPPWERLMAKQSLEDRASDSVAEAKRPVLARLREVAEGTFNDILPSATQYRLYPPRSLLSPGVGIREHVHRYTVPACEVNGDTYYPELEHRPWCIG